MKDVFHGCKKFFQPSYAANFITSWIPSLQGVPAKLEAGAHVADVGCGKGAFTALMAKAFPKSQFFGFDYNDKSIEGAEGAFAIRSMTPVLAQISGDQEAWRCTPNCFHPGHQRIRMRRASTERRLVR
jgi:SAM-dependent methyltransferase